MDLVKLHNDIERIRLYFIGAVITGVVVLLALGAVYVRVSEIDARVSSDAQKIEQKRVEVEATRVIVERDREKLKTPTPKKDK